MAVRPLGVILVLVTIIFPPAGAFLVVGCGCDLLIITLLTLWVNTPNPYFSFHKAWIDLLSLFQLWIPPWTFGTLSPFSWTREWRCRLTVVLLVRFLAHLPEDEGGNAV